MTVWDLKIEIEDMAQYDLTVSPDIIEVSAYN